MTAAPTGWLSEEEREAVEHDIRLTIVFRKSTPEMLQKAFAALAAHATAPDATDLSLSDAMREARRRTEAGDETWVVAQTKWAKRSILLKCIGGDWRILDKDFRSGWSSHQINMGFIETVTCRLITPDAADALLNGNADE